MNSAREPGGGVTVTRPVVVDDALLTGAGLRWLTARVRAARSGRTARDVVGDTAETVLVGGLVAFYLWGVVVQGGAVLGADSVMVTGLGPGLVQVIVLSFAVLSGAGAALRFGPATMPAGGVRWWLPTPADRAGMLTPSVVRAASLALGGGLVSGVAGGVLGGLGILGVLATAAFGGTLGLAVVGVAGVLQTHGSRAARRVAARVADILLMLVPVAGVALATWAPGIPAWVAPWWASVALAVVGAAGLRLWVRGLDRLRAGDLRAWAAALQQAQVAALSADSGAVGLAWAGAARTRRTLTRMTGIARGPASAVLVADALMIVRGGRALVALVSITLVGAFLAQVPVISGGIGLWPLVLAAGLSAARACAPGARAAGENPRLDALVPLGGRAVRPVRAVWPTLGAAAAVTATAMTAVGVAASAGGVLVAVPAIAVVLGAAAVRHAYRGVVRWDLPMVATPMGAFSTGQAIHATTGLDLAILGLLPLAWILVSGPDPVAVLAQYVLAALALATIARSRS
ncbi:hypothetical protein GCM10027059_00820 [Myceligenerans halotolerans]